MKSFFKEAVSTIKTSGTVRPSSKYLINDCLKDLNFNKNQTILQFGVGNGCITQEILNRISSDSQLISFEINEKFYNHCESKFINYQNFIISNRSAIDFEQVLNEHSIRKIDYIISSLPLTLLNEEDVEVLIRKIPKFLHRGGCFVQYQYSLTKYKLLKESFNIVAVDFTIRNVPPTFVYKCFI